MSDEREHSEKKRHGGGHGHGGGGAHEEHEGAPEWLISFADNVTLMMGFFVILLAMNMKEPQAGGIGGKEKNGGFPASNEVIDMAIAVREAFHNPVDMESDDPVDQPLIQRIRQRRGESEADQEGQKGREHDVRSIRPGDYFSQGGSLAFEDASSNLTAAAEQTVAQVCQQLRGINLMIEIRGHVSAAEAFGQADRGMRLSYERASAVGQAFVANGIGWDHLRLIACADNDRLASTAYDEARHRLNQRVEVVITDEVTDEHTPPSP